MVIKLYILKNKVKGIYSPHLHRFTTTKYSRWFNQFNNNLLVPTKCMA